MKRITISVFFFLSAILISAQTLVKVSETIIPIGEHPHELGASGAETGFWKPLFFDIDAAGNFFIPDGYKQRIAVFKPDGSFLREIPVGNSISQRLNYFGISTQGHFVVFNDGTLVCLNPDGSKRWDAPFPMFTRPEAIRAGSDAAYLMIPDDSGKKLGFMIPYKPLFDMTPSESSAGIPQFPIGKTVYSWNIAEQRKLLKLQPQDQRWFPEAPRARFLGADPGGQSVWAETRGSILRTVILSADGTPYLDETMATESKTDWVWPLVRFQAGKPTLWINEDRGNALIIRCFAVK